MSTFLMIAHVALFVVSLVVRQCSSLGYLRNLALPVGGGFIYSSIIQARAAVQNPVAGLEASDNEIALAVSLLCYGMFLAGWAYTSPAKPGLRNLRFRINHERLQWLTVVVLIAGGIAYVQIIRAVGGFWSYFGTGEVTSGYSHLSGYIYMAKHLAYGGAALLLLQTLFGPVSRLTQFILGILLAILTWEAIQTTDRGDTIRAAALIAAWTYLSFRTQINRMEIWAKASIMFVFVAVLAATVVLLPYFRDSGRRLLKSERTLEEAVGFAIAEQGASRFSEQGGEFESAARIIKGVNEGAISPPGPVHIARVVWNVVPRALVTEKWDLFDRWAGPEWQKILIGSSSYYGCVPTGWGESYGTMGLIGAALYWLALGYGCKKYSGWTRGSGAGLVLAAILYLPLVQLVFMAFWSGAMTFLTTGLPVVLIFLFVMRKDGPQGMGRHVLQRQHSRRKAGIPARRSA